MLLLALRMDFVTYSYVASWTSGTLAAGDWKSIGLLAPATCVLLPAAFSRARVLNALSLGDDVAASLGVAVERERLVAMGLATMITGASVAIGGQIGFLGLVAPHLRGDWWARIISCYSKPRPCAGRCCWWSPTAWDARRSRRWRFLRVCWSACWAVPISFTC